MLVLRVMFHLVILSSLLLGLSASFVTKEFTYSKKGQEVGGVILASIGLPSNLYCATRCFSMADCFAFNTIKIGGGKMRTCNMFKEVHEFSNNPDASFYVDSEGYHPSVGFVKFRVRWIKLMTNPLTFATAMAFCAKRQSRMFVPIDQIDNDKMLAELASSGGLYMWYPIDDIAVSGEFRWQNGSLVSPGDPVPWEGGTFGFREQSSADDRCAQIKVNGKVVMCNCAYGDAGVVCESKLQ